MNKMYAQQQCPIWAYQCPTGTMPNSNTQVMTMYETNSNECAKGHSKMTGSLNSRPWNFDESDKNLREDCKLLVANLPLVGRYHFLGKSQASRVTEYGISHIRDCRSASKRRQHPLLVSQGLSCSRIIFSDASWEETNIPELDTSCTQKIYFDGAAILQVVVMSRAIIIAQQSGFSAEKQLTPGKGMGLPLTPVPPANMTVFLF